MIFDNVTSSIWLVFLYSLIGAVVFLLIFNFTIWKTNPFFRKLKGKAGKICVGSLIGAAGLAFLVTVIIGAGFPTLVIINEDFSHTGKYSLFYEGKFIGISGSYIINHTNTNLILKGIDEDKDIFIRINPGEIKKTRRIPESYFQDIPQEQYIRHYSVRGKKRVISGPSVFLVKEADLIKEKEENGNE